MCALFWSKFDFCNTLKNIMQEGFATIIMFNDSSKQSMHNALLDKEWRFGSAASPAGTVMMYGKLPPSFSKRGDNYFMIETEFALGDGDSGQKRLRYAVSTISTSELSVALPHRKQLEHDIIYLGRLKHELNRQEAEIFCKMYAVLCAPSQSGSSNGPTSGSGDRRIL